MRLLTVDTSVMPCRHTCVHALVFLSRQNTMSWCQSFSSATHYRKWENHGCMSTRSFVADQLISLSMSSGGRFQTEEPVELTHKQDKHYWQ